MLPTRQCPHCNNPVPSSRRSNAVYCSNKCAEQANYKKIQEHNDFGQKKLPARTVGAMHELAVSMDLMSRGLHVFRALSGSCPCDLAVLHGKTLIRIEVTTGYRTVNGFMSYPPKDAERYDILAIVEHNGDITYVPELPD